VPVRRPQGVGFGSVLLLAPPALLRCRITPGAFTLACIAILLVVALAIAFLSRGA
jgi:hypothetical protein